MPRFLVCEDGHEYTERFVRLLGGAFRFERAGCFAEAEAATATGAKMSATPAGLLLDLDFRRTPPDRLIDENGAGSAATEEARRRLAEVQGILILRALRAGGRTQPALLFADIDDAEQVRYLERTLAPLQVVSSRTALPDIARLLARISGRTEPNPPA